MPGTAAKSSPTPVILNIQVFVHQSPENQKTVENYRMGKDCCLQICGYYSSSLCLTDHFKGLQQAFGFFPAFKWRFPNCKRQGLKGNMVSQVLEQKLSKATDSIQVQLQQGRNTLCVQVSLKTTFVGVSYQVFPI